MGDILKAVEEMADKLNVVEREAHAAKGFTHPADFWECKHRKKFYALDCGSSGAFLVDKETGELFNIKGYGVPDYNKKQKADLGNVLTVDAKALHSKRWQYLR